jgi:hypothetical protein
MKKELLALLASLLVIAIVVSAASALCSPKRHNYGSDWGEFLREEENTIDVLFIGSSLTYCNIIPAIFWEETGLTAWDVTGPELTIPGAYHYLVEALKTQSPKVVFIETSGALYSRYTGFTKTVIGQMPWGLNRLEMTLREGEPENRLGLLFPMFFYHSRWTELGEDDWAVFREGYQKDMNAGYTYLNQYRVPDGYLVRDDAGHDRENNARNLEYLKKIAALCLEQGITPVFYESPAASMMPRELMDPIFEALGSIDGAVTVNFNDHREAIGAALEGDYYDALHYNAAGAEKFSIFLARWVRENLDATPTGRADEALWQSRVEYIRKLLEQPMTAA